MPAVTPPKTNAEPHGVAIQLEQAVDRLEDLVALYIERAPLLRRRFD
jgi:hypothetical protein